MTYSRFSSLIVFLLCLQPHVVNSYDHPHVDCFILKFIFMKIDNLMSFKSSAVFGCDLAQPGVCPDAEQMVMVVAGRASANKYFLLFSNKIWLKLGAPLLYEGK